MHITSPVLDNIHPLPPNEKMITTNRKQAILKINTKQPTRTEGVNLGNQPQTQEEKYSTACPRCHFEDRDVPALGREGPSPMLYCMTIIVFTRQFPKLLVIISARVIFFATEKAEQLRSLVLYRYSAIIGTRLLHIYLFFPKEKG